MYNYAKAMIENYKQKDRDPSAKVIEFIINKQKTPPRICHIPCAFCV